MLLFFALFFNFIFSLYQDNQKVFQTGELFENKSCGCYFLYKDLEDGRRLRFDLINGKSLQLTLIGGGSESLLYQSDGGSSDFIMGSGIYIEIYSYILENRYIVLGVGYDGQVERRLLFIYTSESLPTLNYDRDDNIAILIQDIVGNNIDIEKSAILVYGVNYKPFAIVNRLEIMYNSKTRLFNRRVLRCLKI